MLRTTKRLMALSLGTSTPDASHLTRRTCTAQVLRGSWRECSCGQEERGGAGSRREGKSYTAHCTYMAAPVLGAPIVSPLLAHLVVCWCLF